MLHGKSIMSVITGVFLKLSSVINRLNMFCFILFISARKQRDNTPVKSVSLRVPSIRENQKAILNTLLIRMDHYFGSEFHQNLWRTHVLHRFSACV